MGAGRGTPQGFIYTPIEVSDPPINSGTSRAQTFGMSISAPLHPQYNRRLILPTKNFCINCTLPPQTLHMPARYLAIVALVHHSCIRRLWQGILSQETVGGSSGFSRCPPVNPGRRVGQLYTGHFFKETNMHFPHSPTHFFNFSF